MCHQLLTPFKRPLLPLPRLETSTPSATSSTYRASNQLASFGISEKQIGLRTR